MEEIVEELYTQKHPNDLDMRFILSNFVGRFKGLEFLLKYN